MFNYTTIEGETWGSIAWKQYGSMSGIKTLIEANPSVPVDAILPRGTILHVPVLDDSEVSSIKNVPWK